MSMNWPKIDPLNFDPNQLTQAEAVALSEAYVALANNPAFKLVIHQVKEVQDSLNNVKWITQQGYTPEMALAMSKMLEPIVLIEQAVVMLAEDSNA